MTRWKTQVAAGFGVCVALAYPVGRYLADGPNRNESATGAAESPGNPKVQPGKVRWHATLADACAAARQSGKPVLLFQMLGKLDDQFC